MINCGTWHAMLIENANKFVNVRKNKKKCLNNYF